MKEVYPYKPILRFLVTDVAGNRTEFATDPVLNESGPKRKGMILPFQPLTMTFHNVDYFVDMPKVILFSSTYFQFYHPKLISGNYLVIID